MSVERRREQVAHLRPHRLEGFGEDGWEERRVVGEDSGDPRTLLGHRLLEAAPERAQRFGRLPATARQVPALEDGSLLALDIALAYRGRALQPEEETAQPVHRDVVVLSYRLQQLGLQPVEHLRLKPLELRRRVGEEPRELRRVESLERAAQLHDGRSGRGRLVAREGRFDAAQEIDDVLGLLERAHRRSEALAQPQSTTERRDGGLRALLKRGDLLEQRAELGADSSRLLTNDTELARDCRRHASQLVAPAANLVVDVCG